MSEDTVESALQSRAVGTTGPDVADELAACALALARRFAAGATMWAVAPAWAEHASHVAVEFVHPVIIGKRALPAVAVEAPTLDALRHSAAGDVLVVISESGTNQASQLLQRAVAQGATSVWIGAGERPSDRSADHVLWLDTADPAAARYDGSTVRLYHLLWELVQLCLEQPGLLGDDEPARDSQACSSSTDPGRRASRPASEFLYPFLGGDPLLDVGALRDVLASSARAKTADSSSLRESTLDQQRQLLQSAATAVVERFERGGRLFTFGNGGSSTDAASLAALFAMPPWGISFSARSLVADAAVLTALGNDVGFERIFSRQLIAFARGDDIAVGVSTSGNSPNVLAAFAEARRRGMLTIGFTGYDGGDTGRSSDVDHCFVVASESVHRIQETHGALSFALWSIVQRQRSDGSHRDE